MSKEIRFLVDGEKCTGCGDCVADCMRRVLVIQNKKAVVTGSNCFGCGHCLAICKENAVKASGCDDEIWEAEGKPVFLDEVELMTHLKFRRSIRKYEDTPVEKEKIDKIIEAGRLTPTASNLQNVRYIVVQKGIDALEDEVMTQYKLKNETPVSEYHAKLPPHFNQDRLKRGFLFHKAPLVIIAVSPSEINACLAAMSMELMAEALGLGTVYVGLFTRPANLNKKLRESLGVEEEEIMAACLAIGYPKVQYQRTAPRKAANVVWK